MSGNASTPREKWGGNIGFILAAAGSAVGLGNIWRFPFITGQNGGGAFVLIYVLCVLLVGLPIMICETTVGRWAQSDPIGAFGKIEPTPGRRTRTVAVLLFLSAAALLFCRHYGQGAILMILSVTLAVKGWRIIGYFSALVPMVILSYYGTVGGWTIAFFFKGLAHSLNFTTPERAAAVLQSVTEDPRIAVPYQLGFMFLCAATIWFGVRRGIELVSKLLLPLLFLLLVVLIIRSVTLPNSFEGVRFLLRPDFSKLSAEGVLLAAGHAFFSLSVGLGLLTAYGSYLDADKNILTNSLIIVLLDTGIALMAGLAIFPALFSVGMAVDQGPKLVFQIMPIIFNSIGGSFGWFWSSIFFLLLAIAALTSGISLLEVTVCCLVDHFRFKRHGATVLTAVVISAIGVLCTISLDDWSRLPALQRAITFLFGGAKGSMFDLADKLSSNYLLPIGGLVISLFVGWVWGTDNVVRQLPANPATGDDAPKPPLAERIFWGIAIRFVAPAAIIIVFLHTIGWL
ncbi:MAG: sodium-dependent transporter [Thermoguttaceae bacterium]|nr:sodium-dependent transporter [Thermoguttaceae bacterium]